MRNFILGVFVALLAAFLLRDHLPRKTVTVIKMQTPTPMPTPTPTPPIYVPWRKLETGKLFNGIQLRSSFETAQGETATAERGVPASYALDLNLKVKVPKPDTSLPELAKLNEQLTATLPALDQLMTSSRVSHFFDDLYRSKTARAQRNLARLDTLPTRHNFFDCETILELQHAQTKRRALLVQADMDVDTDGSNGNRAAYVDGSSPTFQTMTNYKWPKRTATPNPFLAPREARLALLESDAAAHSTQQARDAAGAMRYEVGQLKKFSFLIGADDPYVVLPGSMLGQKADSFAPQIGDYCVVIFKNVLYPAIVGDIGQSDQIGEASLRICQQINANASADNRPVSDLKVTYLVFPNTADKPWAAPDLDKWHARCEQLLAELGGHGGELFAWEDITKPKPTPTPSSTPAPTPGVTPLGMPMTSGAAAISPTPAATPAVSAAPIDARSPRD